ncbi:MAG: hypothetical protein HC785_11580 [Calothrix sp. CSU_2_0]|nr:hypothetical protein [Calothrix sp. CSU_2_0]
MSPIVNAAGASLSRIVVTAWAWEIVALVASLRLRKKVSSNSSIASPNTWTVMVLLVSPGAKVTVPLVAV